LRKLIHWPCYWPPVEHWAENGYRNYASSSPPQLPLLGICGWMSSLALWLFGGKTSLATERTLINFCHCVQLTLLINFIRVICWHTHTHALSHRSR